jgi:autotransporter-associated beta strand protein
MRKITLTSLLQPLLTMLLLINLTSTLLAQRRMEALDRGVVAIKVSNGVYISWRLLEDELYGVEFNLYRDGAKINSSPITESTNYSDADGSVSSTYVVTKIKDGVEIESSNPVTVWDNQYLDVPVRTINGGYSTYQINDGSVGDLDGDGQYEIVIKRLALDKSIESTDYNYLEAYELDGTLLWAINLGPNIYDGVEVNFLVYDFDEDGKAEIATRTSEGTVDGIGDTIGDIDGDGKTNYRYSITYYGYRSEGPDFISIFDGETGAEIVRDNYIALAPISQWGLPGMKIHQYAHRATKCMWTVAYLDGKHPSIVNARGIYERIKMEAWDFDGATLTKRWHFDSSPGGVPTEYHGQGNHNLSLADVDQDGKDEIVYASMVIDDDGTGLYSTGLGHGDALHVLDMDPDRPGMEIWGCHEEKPEWGATYRDAKTGEIMLHYVHGKDLGRCAAGDITAEHKGAEMWAGTGDVFYNVKGEVIGNSPPVVNFMIWWDGDLLREFCDHAWLGSTIGTGIGTISKYNGSSTLSTLLYASRTYSNNYTKGTPVLQADIIGDWREEVIWRTDDNQNIRIYSTIYPTTYRIPTLMQEPQYRLAVAWQNNSYNQPPHTGVYLAAEMQDNIPYPVSNNKVIWNAGTNWDINTSTNWKDESDNSITFHNGDDILFDLTGNNSSPINISTTISPRTVTVTSPSDYIFSGAGKLSSNMALFKAGTGKLTINNTNDYSGVTKVLYGKLVMNGELSNSKVEVGMFGELFANGNFGNNIEIKTDGKIHLGNDYHTAGTPTFQGTFSLDQGAKLYFDLSDDTSGTIKSNDHVYVNGDLTIPGDIDLFFDVLDDTLGYGTYELIKYSGNFSGNSGNIKIHGLEGKPYEWKTTDSTLAIQLQKPRKNAQVIWEGSKKSGTWNLSVTKNWLLDEDTVCFLNKDSVLFTNFGILNNEIDITDIVRPSAIEVNSSGNYTFKGKGEISGNTSLIKSGAGKLFITNKNSYTGPTWIKGGTVEVEKPGNAGVPGTLGSADNTHENIIFEGGTLIVDALNSSTNRNISFNSPGGTIYVGSTKNLVLNSDISGDGMFYKSGLGKVTITRANSISGGVTIKSGEIYLSNKEAIAEGLGSGRVFIENGIINLYNDTVNTTYPTWDVTVPKSHTATINAGSKCEFSGSLEGNGSLNLNLTGRESVFSGDWSSFNGEIDVNSWSDTSLLLLNNRQGYLNISIHLNNNVTALFKENNISDTIEIGALSGTVGSGLSAGMTGNAAIIWKLGSNNTNSIFEGLISDTYFNNSGSVAGIIKTGTGELKISHPNTYTGGTIIEKGTLKAMNTEGSATGSGKVIVRSGATLSGDGYIGGPVTIDSNGVLSPGNSEINSLTIMDTVTMKPGSYYLCEINTDNLDADILHVTGTIALSGTLYLFITGSASLEEGDSIKIIDADSTGNKFNDIMPLYPAKGLVWDTSSIRRDGYLRVKKEEEPPSSGIISEKENLFNIFPNPTSGKLTIASNGNTGKIYIHIRDIMGQLIYSEAYINEDLHTLDLQMLPPGSYLITISDMRQSATSTLMKK